MNDITLGERKRKTNKTSALCGYFRSQARYELTRTGAYFRHLTAQLIAGAFIYSTHSAVGKLCDTADKAETGQRLFWQTGAAVVLICGAFFVFALACGYYYMCAGRAEDALSAIRSREAFVRTLRVFLLLYAPPLCLAGLSRGLLALGYLHPHIGIAAALVFSAILLYVVLCSLAVPFVSASSPFDAYRQSCRIMRGHICTGLYLTAGFLPLVLLSCLTLGALFFVFTTPYIFLSFSRLGEYAYIISEIKDKQNGKNTTRDDL